MRASIMVCKRMLRRDLLCCMTPLPGFNCAEAVNFATPSWIPFGVKAAKRQCRCRKDAVHIDVDTLQVSSLAACFPLFLQPHCRTQSTREQYKIMKSQLIQGGMSKLKAKAESLSRVLQDLRNRNKPQRSSQRAKAPRPSPASTVVSMPKGVTVASSAAQFSPSALMQTGEYQSAIAVRAATLYRMALMMQKTWQSTPGSLGPMLPQSPSFPQTAATSSMGTCAKRQRVAEPSTEGATKKAQTFSGSPAVFTPSVSASAGEGGLSAVPALSIPQPQPELSSCSESSDTK